MENIPVVPIILCGGSGTRLWPLSRELFKTVLAQDTSATKLKKILHLDNALDPILICKINGQAEQMRDINQNPYSIILEPFGKYTVIALGTKGY